MMNFNLDNLSEIIDEVLTEFCVTYPIPNFNSKERHTKFSLTLAFFIASNATVLFSASFDVIIFNNDS